MSRPAVFDRLPDARAVLFAALSAAIMPVEPMTPAAWAESYRKVSAESGSPFPGDWSNDRAPHGVEPMNALGPDDPCEDVVLKWSAQSGKSEIGVNFFGFVVDQDPGPMIIVLPSFDEAGKYVRTKLQPAIDESPRLRAKTLDLTANAERKSTTAFKRFRGGFCQVTFAGSSKGLQMLSARYTIGDEVAEWPTEAGQRGDPIAQLKKRTTNFEHNRKRLWSSTPGVVGTCQISAQYEASDQRRRYVPCPSCGAYQVLTFDRLKWSSDEWPHGAWFECAANGCVIDPLEKDDMLAKGVWIPTAGEPGAPEVFEAEDLATWRDRRVPGRVKGFALWQAYSRMTTWNAIVAEWLSEKDDPEKLRAFTQQVLGEAFEDKGDAPPAELLYAQRVVGFAKGQPPAGPVIFTGATDVQGNRLEWACWGWSEGMTRWLVDWGVIEGDPTDAATWREHDRILEGLAYRPGGSDAPIVPEAWAVDTGYHSHHVYNYTRGRGRIYGVDGRDGRTHPYIGQPKKVDIRLDGRTVKGGAMIWPVGTYGLKSDHYSSIRKTIAGPDDTGAWMRGAMILPGDVPLALVEQLTSEHLVKKERRSGRFDMQWQKLSGRPNEALDLAGYARAMAYHLGIDRLTDDDWAALRAERCVFEVESDQPDMFAIHVAPARRAADTATPKPAAKPKQNPASSDDWLGGRGKDKWQ